ncbi:MAG: DUF4038 domain-containing protein [Chloroflexota bacterium]|nr:DUF4038 domain-containing protein [Chloroflexota bacterium]
MVFASRNVPTEWAYTSGKTYSDPFNEIQLDVVVTASDGSQQRVPAFWAGDQVWRVRYSSAQMGIHQLQSVCSDESNPDLHGQAGTLTVTEYTGTNPLYQHGRVRVAPDQRHLEHQDGTPFFWLADTWWMAFCKRMTFPDGFRELTADRVAHGFTVIQIVAGLYPDMPPFDERGANEAGFPWEQDFSRINPAYFDLVDVRMAHLVQSGLVPALVGFWGYFLDIAGSSVLEKHWRYLIARYGAYPVMWCCAGEALLPWYQSPEFEELLRSADFDTWQPADKRAAWSKMMRFIRTTDPYHNLLTIHPVKHGTDQVDDPTTMDIDWLQTGHGGYQSLAPTIETVENALSRQPKMPVLVSEVCYEGILEGSREEVQRFLFWTCLLCGAAGHTYGANGIWQVNTPEQPHGLSPHGISWGDTPWQDAYRLPGSRQLGLAKRVLERFAWWRFETHHEWIDPHQNAADRLSSYAAGIPSVVRIFYLPVAAIRFVRSDQPFLKALEAGISYRAAWLDPKTGHTTDLGSFRGDPNGDYQLPKPPILQDWVLILEAE